MNDSLGLQIFSFRADDDEDTFLGDFSRLDNFFVGSSDANSEFDEEESDGSWIYPRLFGLRPSEALKCLWGPGTGATRSIGNIWISIHDARDNSKVIGAYFVGDAFLEQWEESSRGIVTVTLSCWIRPIPDRGAGPIWHKWSTSPPASMSEWAELPMGCRGGWLEVVRKCGKVSAKGDAHPGQYVLLGSNIDDLASFYCALGEAMNGPRGYYGSELESLNDCLLGGYGPKAPYRLVWHDSAVAARSLGSIPSGRDGKSAIELIVECFERHGVDLLLS